MFFLYKENNYVCYYNLFGGVIVTNEDAVHHGIKGQKWYVRRYQNEDGTLTPLGRKHYAKTLNKMDQLAADARARYVKYDYKAKKAASKGKIEKANKYSQKAEEQLNLQKKIESNEWKTMGAAIEDGKQVVMKDITRITSSLQHQSTGAAFVAGPIGALAVATFNSVRTVSALNKYGDMYEGDTPYAVAGKKFEVRG